MKWAGMNERIEVWKHDCYDKDGPCPTPCEDPWQVDAPHPHCGTFATFEQAIQHADFIRKLLTGTLKGAGDE